LDSAIALLRGIRDVVEWLHDNGYGDRLGDLVEAYELAPKTGRETIRFAYVAAYRKNVSFLAHIEEQGHQRSAIRRDILGPDQRSLEAPEVIQFPRKWFAPLLLEGFASRRSSAESDRAEDMVAKLSTAICGGGGIRRSEALHIWVSDIQLVDGKPEVFLNHPVNAKVIHETHGEMTRQEYLRTFCGMEPRNQAAGKYHAGWKGVKCNSQWWAPMYWLPFDGIPEHFWRTFEEYMYEVRPRLMRKRKARGLPDHPFLLVCAGSANQSGDLESSGNPYTYDAYGKAWTRAMSRLRAKYGNEVPRVAKNLGTTPHGLRHLYGGLLKELGLSSPVIQECLHHISPLSQQTYTRPHSNKEVSDQLNAAAERTRRGDIGELKSAFRGIPEMLNDLRSHRVERW
jgi:integrase